MVGTTLRDNLIKSGEDLVKQLDASNVLVDAALWFYFPDLETWRLMLSLPEIMKMGPKAAYKEVQKAFSKLGEDQPISLADVTITKTDAPILQLLKIAIKTGTDISHIRFSKNAINGQLIDDVFIYRLN